MSTLHKWQRCEDKKNMCLFHNNKDFQSLISNDTQEEAYALC